MTIWVFLSFLLIVWLSWLNAARIMLQRKKQEIVSTNAFDFDAFEGYGGDGVERDVVKDYDKNKSVDLLGSYGGYEGFNDYGGYDGYFAYAGYPNYYNYLSYYQMRAIMFRAMKRENAGKIEARNLDQSNLQNVLRTRNSLEPRYRYKINRRKRVHRGLRR